MKHAALASALLLGTGFATLSTTAIAANDDGLPRSVLTAPSEPTGSPSSARVAYEFFPDGWRGKHQRKHDNDDDDDEGHENHRRHHDRHGDNDRDHKGGDRSGSRQVDPNASNAPVPDNGVFNGKARPKVEVQ